jgi:site-specific DNA recombinase
MNTANERFKWVKEEFDRIAVNGVLGDPDGKPGMAYLRVSSAGQAEEGRSGFPRQLLHVHEKARELHIAVPWEHVFFDDHTGFEFRDRPTLTKLRNLIKSSNRPSSDLVIENLDRLSREATWHQGFLLDEFEKECKVKVHFWKELSSKLERVVYGTIAQDRMLTDLERMAQGNIIKAKTKRVTARTPAYGYRFVNSKGEQDDVKKDTHYAIYEPEAKIIRLIFTWLVKDRETMLEISRRLTDMGVPLPKRSKSWDLSLLRAIMMNTVYKGEFYAHRKMEFKTIDSKTGRTVKRRVERPRDQWIPVPVPPIVPVQVWEQAQKIRVANRERSLRNMKQEHLLSGLAYCAHCQNIKMTVKAKYTRKNTRKGPKVYDLAAYRCNTRSRPGHLAKAYAYYCTMPQISCKVLDNMVWNAVAKVLLDAPRLQEGIDRYFSRQSVETTREEIAFIQSQITGIELEDERLYQAYIAKAFNAEEFSSKRHTLKENKKKLEEEKEQLQKRLSQQTAQDEKKHSILASVEELHQRTEKDVPFELKRKILCSVVEKVTVNTQEEWFELEGAISGQFDFTPADMGSSKRSA